MNVVAISLGVVASVRPPALHLTPQRPPQRLCTLKNCVLMCEHAFVLTFMYWGCLELLYIQPWFQGGNGSNVNVSPLTFAKCLPCMMHLMHMWRARLLIQAHCCDMNALLHGFRRNYACNCCITCRERPSIVEQCPVAKLQQECTLLSFVNGQQCVCTVAESMTHLNSILAGLLLSVLPPTDLFSQCASV